MKLKSLFLLSLIVGMAGVVHAADEAALAVNFALTHLGVVFTSTGPARTGEARNMAVNDMGDQLVLDGKTDIVITSTGGPAGSTGGGRADNLVGGSSWTLTVGNSTNAFAVPLSSFVPNVGCRNFGDNCNLVKLASIASPVFVKRLVVGDVVGGSNQATGQSGRARIRIFDTQGSTGSNSAPLNKIFDQTLTSGTVADIGVWCSSGVVIMKDSPADFNLYLGRQTRN